ncbi:MAG: OmpH family outer membrane protein [Desulfobulbaceae bacterium]|nr:OmpH family outer membrane protein [Desulfobulbaceae bacterium]
MKFCKHILLLLFFTFSTTAAFAYQNCPDGNGSISQDANLRTGPGTNYKIILPLLKGTNVQTILRKGKWMKVEAIDLQQSGWVHFSLIKNKPCNRLSPASSRKIIQEQGKKKIISSNTGDPAQTAAPLSADVTLQRKRHDIPEAAVNIGVIDIQKVINQSQRGKAARNRYEELRRTGKQDNIDRAEEEIISKIIVEIQTIVETYARENGFTHVLNKNSGSIFYNETSFNITDDIIKEYDRQASLHKTTL